MKKPCLRILWVVLTGFFASTLAFGSTKTVSVQASGFGATQEQAIRAALTSAVSQVNGVSLSSRELTANTAITAAKTNMLGESETAEVKVNSEISASTSTKGQVHSYDVLSLVQQDDQSYKVELSVKVFRYDTPKSSNRKRLAILTPKTTASSYYLFGKHYAGSVAEYVRNQFEQGIVQTRKFAVLSRSDLGDIADELALIASDATSAEEKAKLGRMLGADYLLIPTIIKAAGNTSSEKIRVTGQTKTTSYGEVMVSVKVVVPATGEIKFSDQYSANTSRSLGVGLFDYAVAKAVTDLVDRIYPKLIVQATNNNYIINGGGDSVKKGQTFDVYSKGEAVIDPYTGESLGSTESWMGKIKVVRVDPKMAHATLLEGGPLSVGMVLRPSKDKQVSAKPVQSSEPKATSGIRLPFD